MRTRHPCVAAGNSSICWLDLQLRFSNLRRAIMQPSPSYIPKKYRTFAGMYVLKFIWLEVDDTDNMFLNSSNGLQHIMHFDGAIIAVNCKLAAHPILYGQNEHTWKRMRVPATEVSFFRLKAASSLSLRSGTSRRSLRGASPSLRDGPRPRWGARRHPPRRCGRPRGLAPWT